jgi:tRNA nucleotidyltransferase (CCA-adding enzyme)
LGLLLFWLARDEQEELVERLNLPTQQRTILKQAHQIRSQQQTILAASRGSLLYHLLAATSAEARLIAWLALQAEPVAAQIARFQTDLKAVKPLIDGAYLKAEFALHPGPIYGRVLDALRDARLDGLVTTLADERKLVEEILGDEAS